MSEPNLCPVCKSPVTPGDTVDVGVGPEMKCGPDYCEYCGWVESDPMNHGAELE